MTQRGVKTIDRFLHPERHTEASLGLKGWAAGNGGWGDERLKGYENDMECQVDQFWADEIDADKLFQNYIARGAPVLIRGLLQDWPAVQNYTHDELRLKRGDFRVQVLERKFEWISFLSCLS
jgi:hypothetical protein